MSHAAQAPPVRPAAWRVGPVLPAALVLLVVQTVWRASMVRHGYFWQDDFRYLADARRSGLTAGYLLQDYNGHVMPGQFFLVWVAARFGFSFAAPAVMLVVLQLLASVLLLLVLWLLWPRRPEILVGYAVYLFSPLGLVADTWWAAGLQALPLQCCMLLAVAGCVLDHRSPARRWRVVTVAALVAGLAFWEKALLIVPLLVLVQVLLLEDARWSDRRRLLRRYGVEWSIWLLVGLCYTVGYVILVGRTRAASGPGPSYQDFLVEAVGKMLLPGVLGGPWTGRGGANTVYPVPGVAVLTLTGLVLVLAAGWVWRRQPREAVKALVLVGAYLALDLGLVLLVRSQFAALLARDPRYVTDALPVVAIGVVAAVAPRVRAPYESRPGRSTRPVLAVCLGLCAALVGSSFVSVQALGSQLSHGYAENYVTRLLRDHRAMPGATVLDASAPPVGVVAQPVSTIFAAAGEAVHLDRPSADLRMANGFGALAPVTTPDPAFAVRGPTPGCGWLVSADREVVRTRSGPWGPRRVVQLGYYAGKDTAIVVSLSAVGAQHPVIVPAGIGTISLVTRARVRVVAFSRPRGDSPLCVTDLRIGAPWPAG